MDEGGWERGVGKLGGLSLSSAESQREESAFEWDKNAAVISFPSFLEVIWLQDAFREVWLLAQDDNTSH